MAELSKPISAYATAQRCYETNVIGAPKMMDH